MKNIFLIEDDQLIAEKLIKLLESERYQVIHATTRSQALELFPQQSFDLVLLDISLPDGNGFSVYTAMKEIEVPPVIFLTASDDEASVVTGLDMGAADYIAKPFRPRELLARIHAAMRKNGDSKGIFKMQDLQVDTVNGVVKKDGKEIFLSALEYRLLLIFVNHPKQILTRVQLLDEIWDASGEFVTDNTLTVYIKRLREKIEVDPGKPSMIRTVRGIGYRLGEG